MYNRLNLKKISLPHLLILFFLSYGANAEYPKLDPYKTSKNSKGKKVIKGVFNKQALLGSKYAIFMQGLADEISNDKKNESEKIKSFSEKITNKLNKVKENPKKVIDFKYHMTVDSTGKSQIGSNTTLLEFAIKKSRSDDFVDILLNFKLEDTEKPISLVDTSYKNNMDENALFWWINRVRQKGIDNIAMDILVLLITDGKVQLNQNYNIKKRGELPAFHLILETLNPYLRDINNRQEREIALNIVTLLLNAGIDCKATDSEGRESSDFQLYTDIEKANESILKNKGIEKVRESISRKLKIAKLNNLQDLRSKKNLGTFATNSDFDEINNKISKLNEELLNVI